MRIKNNIVYCIDFPNGKKYIGISSYGLEYRKKAHMNSVNCGSQLYVHKALRKYGNTVEWSVIEYCDTIITARERERYFIKFFDTRSSEKGYNLTDGGEGSPGLRFTEESRKKLSRSHTGLKQTPEHVENHRQKLIGRVFKNARKLIATSVETGEIEVYASIIVADRSGFTKSAIAACCNNKQKTHKGRTWKYME